MDLLVAFLSGVGVTLSGTLIADLLTRRRERRKLMEERSFQIYMKLIELHGLYFWFTSDKIRGEPVSPEIRHECRSLAWEIADMLRAADAVEYLDQILEVLFGPRFTTAVERHEVMGQILDRLGQRVNPRYWQKIREISEGNLQLLASGGSSNAPGAPRGCVKG